MDSWQALDKFWSSFGWPAYDDQTTFVEDDLPAFPHITYESGSGDFGTSRQLAAHLWDRSTSWMAIKQKAVEIQKALEGGGVLIPFDGGALWIKIPDGTGFGQSMATGASDELIKRIMINISVDII